MVHTEFQSFLALLSFKTSLYEGVPCIAMYEFVPQNYNGYIFQNSKPYFVLKLWHHAQREYIFELTGFFRVFFFVNECLGLLICQISAQRSVNCMFQSLLK